MSGYSTPGFFEKKIERETAARVAAFLGGLGRGSENLGATGVRSDWMEQEGPAFGVLFHMKIRDIDTAAHIKESSLSACYEAEGEKF